MIATIKVFPFVLMFVLIGVAYFAQRSDWKTPIRRPYVYVLLGISVALSMTAVLVNPIR